MHICKGDFPSVHFEILTEIKKGRHIFESLIVPKSNPEILIDSFLTIKVLFNKKAVSQSKLEGC